MENKLTTSNYEYELTKRNKTRTTHTYGTLTATISTSSNHLNF